MAGGLLMIVSLTSKVACSVGNRAHIFAPCAVLSTMRFLTQQSATHVYPAALLDAIGDFAQISTTGADITSLGQSGEGYGEDTVQIGAYTLSSQTRCLVLQTLHRIVDNRDGLH